jgi:DNA-directed RNA polymerase subunit H (RpoH/RPB5)
LPEENFSVRDLGIAIAKILGIEKGDVVEVKRDLVNADRVVVLRHRGQEAT